MELLQSKERKQAPSVSQNKNTHQVGLKKGFQMRDPPLYTAVLVTLFERQNVSRITAEDFLFYFEVFFVGGLKAQNGALSLSLAGNVENTSVETAATQ